MKKIKIVLLIIFIFVLSGCGEYTCPDGYTLNGKSCSKDINTDVLVKYECPENYELISGECQMTITADATASKYCDKGYEYSDGICILVDKKAAAAKTYCISGTLKDGLCYEVQYSTPKASGSFCPEGYSYYNDSQCYRYGSSVPTKTIYKNGYTTTGCDDGYELYLGSCRKKIIVSKEASYICTEGVLRNGQCVSERYISIARTDYSCEAGYNLIGATCLKTDVKDYKTKYTCTKGYTLKNNKCHKVLKAEKTEVKYCEDGIIPINEKCVGKVIIRAEKK